MSNDQLKRVVVTGVGTVSPLGLDTASTWEALINGKSGADYIIRGQGLPVCDYAFEN